jgi:hypothetical protein
MKELEAFSDLRAFKWEGTTFCYVRFIETLISELLQVCEFECNNGYIQWWTGQLELYTRASEESPIWFVTLRPANVKLWTAVTCNFGSKVLIKAFGN